MMKQEHTPLTTEEYQSIKVGDIIERMLGFAIPIYVIVSEITDNLIICGPWTFDRKTGIEVDDDIPSTVSYIRRILTDEMKELLSGPEKLERIPYPFEPKS